MAIVAIFAKNRKIIAFVNKQMAELELLFVLGKQAFSKLAAILEPETEPLAGLAGPAGRR